MTCTSSLYSFFFFFNDTATTEIYTLSLHDALPISLGGEATRFPEVARLDDVRFLQRQDEHRGCIINLEDTEDRKSTRLNSSHLVISYAVFCLKKKKNNGELAELT